MGTLSIGHWVVVALVVVLVLGPKRVAEAGKGLGKALREFRSAVSHDDSEPKG